MLLKYFDSAGIVARYDEGSGSLTLEQAPRQMPWQLLNGCFTVLSGVIVALYRLSDDVWLCVGERVVRLGDASIKYERSGGIGTLVIGDCSGTSSTFSYPLHEGAGTGTDDFTPFADEEDFDFGLYLLSLSNDEDRRTRVWRAEL